MSAPLALDISVAVPLMLRSHAAHALVNRWWAARLIAARCEPALVLGQRSFLRLPDLLADADADVVGGAVYDAVVALAAVDNDAVLASRDARAQATYERVGARVEIVV